MALAHYIMVTGDLYVGDRLVKAQEIADALLARGIWLIWKRTPYQNDYHAGDRILIYLARSGKCHFVAAAEFAGKPEPASREELALASRMGLTGYDRKVRLRDICRFEEGISIRPLINDLTFVREKRWWGQYFRQSALRIPQSDFHMIVQSA